MTREEIEFLAHTEMFTGFKDKLLEHDAEQRALIEQQAKEIDRLKIDHKEINVEFDRLNGVITQQMGEIEQLQGELGNAEGALWRKGYKKECNTPACNCGPQWNHGGNAEERLMEISDVLPYANGLTVLQRVEQLKAQLATAKGEVWEQAMRGYQQYKAQITPKPGCERFPVQLTYTFEEWCRQEAKREKEGL